MVRSRTMLLLLLAFCVAFSFAIVGCDLEPEGADATDAATDATTSPPDAVTDSDVAVPKYRFVRIDDLSTVNASEDGGADIDAVIVTKADASVLYADAVEASYHGGVDGLLLDPNDILGEPDAFYEYPDVTNCKVNDGFMSLGGLSGYVVVRMSGDMDAGDDLTVLEVGGCAWDNGTDTGTAFIEDIKVSISLSADLDGTWVALGQGTGPEVNFTIP